LQSEIPVSADYFLIDHNKIDLDGGLDADLTSHYNVLFKRLIVERLLDQSPIGTEAVEDIQQSFFNERAPESEVTQKRQSEGIGATSLERLRRYSECYCPSLYIEVLEPTFSDLYQEYSAEQRPWAACIILIRGCCALAAAAFWQLCTSFAGRLAAAFWRGVGPR
jgi:hypothetical protein